MNRTIFDQTKPVNRAKHKLATLLCVIWLGGCVPTVDFVDVERYMGLWYQIAAYETPFNEELVAVTAEYTLREDGTVQVYNRGYEQDFDGAVDEILGTATIANPETNAELIVNFPSVPFNFPFPNYLIVVLDEENYQYAAVTDPFRSTLFILSRTPQLDEATYNLILEELRALKINTDRLVLTPQPDNIM
ncbi:MAG: lipocalin family protein [Ketobacteraceae bacterium]|nr:lipocalin family protein [Ketobacteraceae bacterium]